MKNTFGAGVLAVALLSSGCGYTFPGGVTRLPDDVRTISLGPIRNATREIGIEKVLVEAIEDEVVSHDRLEVVPQGNGDVVLTGTIRGYATRPVAFSSRDEALEYQATVFVDLELRRQKDGKLLWKVQNLRERADYSAVPGVVVTSSSRFQRSTVDATNIGRFTDIQLSEGQKREANERLVETLARTVYTQMMEDF